MGGLLCRHSQAFQYAQTGPKGPTKLKQAYLVTASGGTEIGAAGDCEPLSCAGLPFSQCAGRSAYCGVWFQRQS
jgi:hypothetical protein